MGELRGCAVLVQPQFGSLIPLVDLLSDTFRRPVYWLCFVSYLRKMCLVPKNKSIKARPVEPTCWW